MQLRTCPLAKQLITSIGQGFRGNDESTNQRLRPCICENKNTKIALCDSRKFNPAKLKACTVCTYVCTIHVCTYICMYNTCAYTVRICICMCMYVCMYVWTAHSVNFLPLNVCFTQVKVTGLESKVVRVLLHYLYTGKCCLTLEDLNLGAEVFPTGCISHTHILMLNYGWHSRPRQLVLVLVYTV